MARRPTSTNGSNVETLNAFIQRSMAPASVAVH
jgi:hypothetical protein